MPADRCGYEFDMGTNLTAEKRACCWRETWGDTDRCKWHLDEDKSDIITQSHFIDEADYLVDSVFRGASLPGGETLEGRHLQGSDFSETDLRDANISEANLSDVNFSDADLSGADLSEANIKNADFSEANLHDANLRDADARGATFERANLENAAMTRTNLRNANIRDARLFEVSFSDTWINEATELGELCVYEKEADTGIDRDHRTVERHHAAAWSYRALENLCRENALPGLTRHYFVREKEARRKHAWETKNYRHALKAEASRWVMEHGSNPWRIVGVSAFVIVLFGLLYPVTGGLVDSVTGPSGAQTASDAPSPTIITYWPEGELPEFNVLLYDLPRIFGTSLYFSVVTFATLGYGDIYVTGLARGLATIETILGSVLIALLVFVLSRSVTW